MIGFRGCRIQICYLNFSGSKERCYGNQIGRNKPKLHKFQFCIKYWEFFRVNSRVLLVSEFTYDEFLTDLKELPRQPNLSKRQPKLHWFQFGARNPEILTVNSGVFGVSELKYAIRIFSEANNVANTTKFRQKYVKTAHILVLCKVRRHLRVSGLANSNMLSEFFR